MNKALLLLHNVCVNVSVLLLRLTLLMCVRG